MRKFEYFVVVLLVFVAVKIHGVQGAAMVSGTVFCDQCKDGHVSMFDYPLSGMKVTMVCPGNDGKMTTVAEDTTNMVGGYGMTFDGSPDLSACFTQLSPNTNTNTNAQDSSDNKCGVAPGPPKPVKLMFSMFDMEMFSVDPLISQPAQPMSYCSSSPSPRPPSTSPTTPVAMPPPSSSGSPSEGSGTPLSPSAPRRAPTPAFRLPPMPPAPFLKESACSYENWMKPEYKCYWRAVNPDTPVALVFGPLAAQKYGTDLTLYSGLKGKGDPYKTLLRESVTALLNSYNSFRFPYNALQVLHSFNTALMGGSTHNVLVTALKFKRANSGSDGSPCKLETCN